jgi:membrane protein
MAQHASTGTRQPDDPTDLTRPTWGYVAKKTGREFMRDECMDQAAGLTYYAVLGLFPALIALLSLVGLVGQQQQTTDALLGVARDLGVPSADDTLAPVVESLATASQPGLAFFLGLATALWSASTYVSSFGRAMNRIYEIREGRPFWKLRPFMLLVTLVAILLAAAVALMLVLTGPVARAVGDLVGLGETAVTVWGIAKWPVMIVAVALAIAILYYATPNVKQPKFRWISVGAVVAIVTWAIASALFGLYVSNVGSYNETYGALAGVVVFLLWLWITNMALLFGAELDAELERGRELQAGLPAEQSVQLPARDTRGIEKKERQEREEIEQGRALRRSAGERADAEGGRPRR